MLKQNADLLNEVQLELMNTLMGYEDTKKLHRKRLATKRLLKARRGIEERHEQHNLAKDIDKEAWFDSL
mgnify:CR=1 FL=1